MLINFLKTERSKEDLAVALAVLREFKSMESTTEYLATPFSAWMRLEQLEEYLDHLANGADLEADTLAELERIREEG